MGSFFAEPENNSWPKGNLAACRDAEQLKRAFLQADGLMAVAVAPPWTLVKRPPSCCWRKSRRLKGLADPQVSNAHACLFWPVQMGVC